MGGNVPCGVLHRSQEERRRGEGGGRGGGVGVEGDGNDGGSREGKERDFDLALEEARLDEVPGLIAKFFAGGSAFSSSCRGVTGSRGATSCDSELDVLV